MNLVTMKFLAGSCEEIDNGELGDPSPQFPFFL